MYKHKRQRAERESLLKHICQRNACKNKKQGNETKVSIKIYFSFYTSPKLERTLSQLNPIHILATEFL
jgi:hypothetical protein